MKSKQQNWLKTAKMHTIKQRKMSERSLSMSFYEMINCSVVTVVCFKRTMFNCQNSQFDKHTINNTLNANVNTNMRQIWGIDNQSNITAALMRLFIWYYLTNSNYICILFWKEIVFLSDRYIHIFYFFQEKNYVYFVWDLKAETKITFIWILKMKMKIYFHLYNINMPEK